MKSIEWADITLNAVVGCHRGCPYCYAKKINDRFHFIKDFNKPQVFIERLEKLNHIKNKKIFMNSMSDIEYFDGKTIRILHDYMSENNSNTYIFLTKNPYALPLWHEKSNFLTAIQMQDTCNRVKFGITITTQKQADEYYYYLKHNHTYSDIYKIVNIEPILQKIKLKKFRYFKNTGKDTKPDLIILGAETGNRKNKVIPKREWIEDIIDFCKKYNIELFLKENIKKYLNKGE